MQINVSHHHSPSPPTAIFYRELYRCLWTDNPFARTTQHTATYCCGGHFNLFNGNCQWSSQGQCVQCVTVCWACYCVELVRQPCRLLVGPKNPAENTFGNPGHAGVFLMHVCFYVPISWSWGEGSWQKKISLPNQGHAHKLDHQFDTPSYGVATISRLPKNTGLFCKKSPIKKIIFCKRDVCF